MTVGAGPSGIGALSTDKEELYVSHPDGNTIDVVDIASGRLARSLIFKGEPFGIAAGPGIIYVADWAKRSITRLDAITGEPTASVTVGESPAGLVADAAHHRLYAADRESGDVSVIDTSSMQKIASIATGAAPFALALSPDGARLYVGNVRSNDLAVIDTDALRRVATVAAGMMPYGVAVTPDGATILVTNQHADTLTLIDAKTLKVIGTIPVGRYPEGVIATSDTRAFVANWFSGDLSVIDLAARREISRIKVGDGPRNFAAVTGPATSAESRP